MGPLGWQETVFIFVLALLIFGPKKLPELGRTIGKAMTEFRRASSELKATFDREMASIERENESLKQTTQEFAHEIQYSYNDYDSYSYDYGAYDSESSATTSTNSSTVSASATQGADKQEGNHPAEPPQAAEVAGSEVPKLQGSSESIPHAANS